VLDEFIKSKFTEFEYEFEYEFEFVEFKIVEFEFVEFSKVNEFEKIYGEVDEFFEYEWNELLLFGNIL
jgi:hypothetical protein